MLTLRMAKWPDDTGLVHESTTWQIATDAQFENIMDETEKDETFLDIWYSNVVVPKNEVYWGRSKRHFDNGTETDWISPVKLLPAEAGDNVDIKPEVVVETPYAFIDKEEVLDENQEQITLKSGAFRCKHDGHLATNWILRDGAGRAVYIKMYDKVNKNELILSKAEVDIENVNNLTLEVSHVTANNYESAFGRHKINLNKYKFEVLSNTHSVSPIKDYKFEFKVLRGVFEEYPLDRIKVRDTDNKVVYEKELKDENFIIIDREILKENSTYFVDFYQKDIVGEVRTIVFSTVDNKGTYVIDPEYVYKETIEDSGMTASNIRQCTSEQLLDNGIPLAIETDGTIKMFNFDRRLNTFTISDLPVSFLKKSTNDHEHLTVRLLDVDRIIVDRPTGEDNAPEFTVFDYEHQVLKGIKERANETKSTGLTNNLAINLSGNECFYFAKDDDVLKFRRLDTKTMEVTDLTIRPDLLDEDANLVYIGDGRLLSFNSSSKHLVYTYDIKNDLWNDVTLVPERFRDLKMTSFMRKDGRVASFNTGNGTNDVLLFDPSDNTMVGLVNDLDDTIDLDTTIRLRNGEFLRLKSNTENSKIYIYK